MRGPALKIATRAPARTEALVVAEGHELPAAVTAELERALGVNGRAAAVRTLGLGPAPLVVGLRLPDLADTVAMRRLFGRVGRILAAENVRSASLVLPAGFPPERAGLAVQGLFLGLYRFDRYRNGEGAPLPALTLVTTETAVAKAARAGLPVAEGQWIARDLVNTPAEDMGPSELEAEARRLAKEAGLKIRVLDAARCRRLGMGALTTVGRDSA